MIRTKPSTTMLGAVMQASSRRGWLPKIPGLVAVLSVASVAMTGCSFGGDNPFRDRSDDYLRATEITPIQVPEDLDRGRLGQIYQVPQAGQVAPYQIDSEFEVPRPQRLSAQRSEGQVRIQSLGDEKWILVPASPGEIWPRVRAFLTRNEIATASADADRGVIVTDWLTFDDDAEKEHQFRLEFEQGVQLNTTEIDVTQRQRPAGESGSDSTAWPETSADAERADWMRTRLAEELAAEGSSGAASLVGQDIGATAKVELVAPRVADPYLSMKLNYERAWASVEFALESPGFEVESQDVEAGRFDIRYRQPVEKQRSGLMRWLFGDKQNEARSYRIRVRDVEGEVEVRILQPDGSSLSQQRAYQLLSRLRQQLT